MVLELQPQQQIQVEAVDLGVPGTGSTTPINISSSSSSSSSSFALLHQTTPFTLNLFHSFQASSSFELLQESAGDQINCTTMSRNNGRKGLKLDLKLNLSPPRANLQVEPNRSSRVSSSPTSPASSCLSSELNNDDTTLRYSNSPEATSMVLVGCPRCLMYVMLSEDDPKCPKCKSTVLLDFLHDNCTKKTRND